jgi:hypothetical protein
VGGKQESAAFKGFNWLPSIRYPHMFVCFFSEAEGFSFAVLSTAKEK